MKPRIGKTFWIISCPDNSLFHGSEREYFYDYEEAVTAVQNLSAEFPGNMFLVMEAVAAGYAPPPKPVVYRFAEAAEHNGTDNADSIEAVLRENFSALLRGRRREETEKSDALGARTGKGFIRAV